MFKKFFLLNLKSEIYNEFNFYTKMKKIVWFIFFGIYLSACVNSQVKNDEVSDNKNDTIQRSENNNYNIEPEDLKIISSILKKAKENNWFEKEMGNIVVLVGKELLGTEYVGGVLDKNEPEKLVINLRQLDCVTFVENCSALSKVIKMQSVEIQDYVNTLQALRYRNAKIDDYASRLHYFSDWLLENEKAQNVKLFAKELSNQKRVVKFSIMTENREKYPKLANDSLFNKLKMKESELSKLDYYYIPENEIDKYKNQIPDGSIIGITTNLEGLDITHTGLAIHVDGNLHLFHASSKTMKVEISEKTIQNMLKDSKIQTGIVVAKLL